MLEELFSLAARFSFDDEDFTELALEMTTTEDWILVFGQWKCLFIVFLRILKQLGIRGKNISLLQGVNFLTYFDDEKSFDYDILWAGVYDLQLVDWHLDDTGFSLDFLMEDGDGDEKEEELKKYFTESFPEEDIEMLVSLVINDALDSQYDFLDVFGYIELYSLPWLRKAEQLTKTGNLDPRMKKVLDEVGKIQGVYKGKKAYYCPVYSLQGECLLMCYPSAFAPFKLTVYEAIAKAYCLEMDGVKHGCKENSINCI